MTIMATNKTPTMATAATRMRKSDPTIEVLRYPAPVEHTRSGTTAV
jgi:hypothetical protein